MSRWMIFLAWMYFKARRSWTSHLLICSEWLTYHLFGESTLRAAHFGYFLANVAVVGILEVHFKVLLGQFVSVQLDDVRVV